LVHIGVDMLRKMSPRSPRSAALSVGSTHDTDSEATIARLEEENKALREENAALIAQNRKLRSEEPSAHGETYDARDDEIAFLRRRLACIRAIALGTKGETAMQISASPRDPPPPVPQGVAFPGVKLRSETVLKKAPPTKLAIAPAAVVAEESKTSTKKKGSWLGSRK
jgi:hypothetical protein